MSQLSRKPVEQAIQENLTGIQNILGEVLWHSLTLDPTIEEVSCQHYQDIDEQIKQYTSSDERAAQFGKGCRFLEVAAYAHVTGYLLAQDKDWQVTLSDVSVDTLALGAKHANEMGLDTSAVRRTAVDFHDLPFETGEFDVVYISAALHHTDRWETVLRELMRVVTPGGLLIIQCEPVMREFCLYNFETNRPGEFRPIEAELDRLEILRTIAQPYYGSRPEFLFGMIENQKMPIDTILEIIKQKGEIIQLEVDVNISMSAFDKDILEVDGTDREIEGYIVSELSKRACSAEKFMHDIDHALGIRMPEQSDIERLAHKVAPMITDLPDLDSPEYKTALASIFGGSIKVVAKIGDHSSADIEKRYPVYCKNVRKGVDIAFPPNLSEILEKTEDLLPEIQHASASELERYFPPSEWDVGYIEGTETKYLSLMRRSGNIVLQTDAINTSWIVLIRVWADPSQNPFRVSLFVDDDEVAGFDVYQTESFLLNAFISKMEPGSAVSLRAIPIGSADVPSDKVLPVTVGAARFIAINNAT